MNRVIATLATLAAASSVALAQHGNGPKSKPHQPPGPEQAFAKMDKNHDGTISLAEFKAGPAGQKNPAKAEEYFKLLDKDGDGKLAMTEFLHPQPLPDPTRAELFKKLDTNNDRTLSLDEFKQGPLAQRNPDKAAEYFKRFDANGDGKLSPDEFIMHHPAPQPPPPPPPTAPDKPATNPTPEPKVEVE